MIREVYPGLWVGDGEAPNSDIKRLAGYEPGPVRCRCTECEIEFLGTPEATRCLDCALIDINANWYVIHAAKEPWHRNALGYTGRGAPADHPEYLVARRPGEMMLNLVDMKSLNAQYTDPIFEAALQAISENLDASKKVLVHCNEGKSRGPTIALVWLGVNSLEDYHDTTFDQAVEKFRETYPEYEPGAGVEAYARNRWPGGEEVTNGADPVP